MNFQELLEQKVHNMETVSDLSEISILLYLIWKPHPHIGSIDIENLFDENGHLSEQAKKMPSLIGLVDCLTGRDRYKQLLEQHQFMYLVGYNEGKKFMQALEMDVPLSPYDS